MLLRRTCTKVPNINEYFLYKAESTTWLFSSTRLTKCAMRQSMLPRCDATASFSTRSSIISAWSQSVPCHRTCRLCLASCCSQTSATYHLWPTGASLPRHGFACSQTHILRRRSCWILQSFTPQSEFQRQPYDCLLRQDGVYSAYAERCRDNTAAW